MSHQLTEFEVPYGDGAVVVRMHTPDALRPLTQQALLLTFAGAAEASLGNTPYRLAANAFVANGHRALSFDMPNHGSLTDAHGEGITGMRNAFVAGDDPFRTHVERGRAVIEHCLAEGLATPGRIATSGTSRGGYMALRLLAEDDRIAAGAGFAPVTDWRDLREFDADCQRQDVSDLSLSRHAQALADRAVYLVIGNHDERVNTARCCQLVANIAEARRQNGQTMDGLDFYCTGDPGHSCADTWYHKGARFLLQHV